MTFSFLVQKQWRKLSDWNSCQARKTAIYSINYIKSFKGTIVNQTCASFFSIENINVFFLQTPDKLLFLKGSDRQCMVAELRM